MSEEKKPKKRGRPAKRRKPAKKKANKGGQPSKFTPEVKARILEALRLGASYEHAANYGGVRYYTYRRWIEKGEKATRGEYCEFCEEVKKVEAQAAILLLAKIEKAATDGKWKAAAWKLAKRHPEMYGEKSEVPTKPFVAPRVVQGEEFTDPWLVEDEEE